MKLRWELPNGFAFEMEATTGEATALDAIDMEVFVSRLARLGDALFGEPPKLEAPPMWREAVEEAVEDRKRREAIWPRFREKVVSRRDGSRGIVDVICGSGESVLSRVLFVRITEGPNAGSYVQEACDDAAAFWSRWERVE